MFHFSLSHIYICNNLKNKENKKQAELQPKTNSKPQCMQHITLGIQLNHCVSIDQVKHKILLNCKLGLDPKGITATFQGLSFVRANRRNLM